MVKVTFWTANEDFKDAQWPNVICQPIYPGDWVEEIGGKRKLKVKSITHIEFDVPRLRVELGK